MNIGSNIFNLRKQKNITQEALAAELGVTAAAVSKWEKGYTLPDILMLCALADFFEITTDELLGRSAAKKHAIVIADNRAFADKIVELVEKYDIKVRAVFSDHEAGLAFEAAHKDELQYAFTAAEPPFGEEDPHNSNGLIHVNVYHNGGSDEDKLNGIELYLKNEDAFKNIAGMTSTGNK
jgi:transcriptional regulator with XRE-family HTH domain